MTTPEPTPVEPTSVEPTSVEPTSVEPTSVEPVETTPEVGALAINVVIPPGLRWQDTRRDQTFELSTLTIRLLPDGHLAMKAYGKPLGGGRGAYTSFAVPDRPELAELAAAAASRAAELWSGHQGLG